MVMATHMPRINEKPLFNVKKFSVECFVIIRGAKCLYNVAMYLD